MVGIVNLHATLRPVPDAAYNGGGPRVSNCLQGTRVGIMKLIMGWVDGTDDRSICWVNGPAGFGKSSIARTICAGQQKLAASFFFLRGAGDRSKIARFIRTLAYHISVSIPATQPLLEDALRVIHSCSINRWKINFRNYWWRQFRPWPSQYLP